MDTPTFSGKLTSRSKARDAMMKSFPTLIACPALALGLASCGTMDLARKTGEATSEKLGELAKFSVSDLLPPKVKVVEVREKDLKNLPLGEDRALAYADAKRRSLWATNVPATFNLPPLPEGGVEMDGSLLPPKPE
jgi:hypothetical protein